MSARLSAQLEFLVKRPFDLLVSVKLSDDATHARRIEIYYAEHGVLSGFKFRLQDAQFAGERGKMVRAATKALLAEVKSRVLAGQEFCVWYYEIAGQDLLELEAAHVVKDEPVWQRACDKLLRVGRIVNGTSS